MVKIAFFYGLAQYFLIKNDIPDPLCENISL